MIFNYKSQLNHNNKMKLFDKHLFTSNSYQVRSGFNPRPPKGGVATPKILLNSFFAQ